MNDATLSGFDPATFLNATITEANTRRPPIPGGTVLRGTLGQFKYRQTEGKKETNQGQVYHWLDIPVELDLTSTPAVREHVGQDKVTLTHSFGLDFGTAGLDMSKGKNVGLMHLRNAIGMNTEGQPFNLNMMIGRQVLVTIGNRPYQNEVYDEIKSIAKV